MNEIQFFGAHNAYHRELQGAELDEALKIDPGLPSWAYYSHASIPDQLGRQNLRAIELDLLPDPEGGLYQHPLPRQRAGLGPIDDPDLAKPGMKVQHVPDVDYNTTCTTLVRCLEQVRFRDMYLEGHPNLEGRAVFTRGRPGDPDAAITMVNDPRDGGAERIEELVRRGYIVRTRSDVPLETVKNEEFSRVQIALDSGAQLITTDFPTVGMAARWDSDFVAELPGGVPVRCNPVTAPRGCVDASLERNRRGR